MEQPSSKEDPNKNSLGATQPKDAPKAPAGKDTKTAPASPIKGGDKTPAPAKTVGDSQKSASVKGKEQAPVT